MMYVYMLVYSMLAFPGQHFPVFADLGSCEKVRAVAGTGAKGQCIQVLVPAPSEEAYKRWPAKELK